MLHFIVCYYQFVNRSLAKAAVILLPLLGLTWVFGLLAVNEDTVAFAWIFTILNSLQVGTVEYVNIPHLIFCIVI